LVGSAVEHAAELHVKDAAERVAAMVADRPACPPVALNFRNLFLAGEVDEEQTSGLVTVLDVLKTNWPNGCKASEISSYASAATEAAIEFKAALEQASGKTLRVITPRTVAWMLKALAGVAIQVDRAVIALRYQADHHGGTFEVRTVQ
jgi:hypothetical protein